MEILLPLCFFVFGAIIGSFLNVVILRYNTGEKISGRSHCFSCGKNIAWRDLIPILSFWLLSGKCRFCKSKISFQYPLVELLTGLLFLAVFLRYFPLGFSPLPTTHYLLQYYPLPYYLLFSTDLFVMALLVVITVYDLRHKIIPDLFAFLLGALTLVKVLISGSLIYGLLAGPIVALPFFLLWLFSSGRWIGLGDSKLSLSIGWFLGLSYGFSAIVLGSWIGAVVGLSLVGIGKLRDRGLNLRFKKLTMKSEIPYAPFLIAGLLLTYFFSIDLVGL